MSLASLRNCWSDKRLACMRQLNVHRHFFEASWPLSLAASQLPKPFSCLPQPSESFWTQWPPQAEFRQVCISLHACCHAASSCAWISVSLALRRAWKVCELSASSARVRLRFVSKVSCKHTCHVRLFIGADEGLSFMFDRTPMTSPPRNVCCRKMRHKKVTPVHLNLRRSTSSNRLPLLPYYHLSCFDDAASPLEMLLLPKMPAGTASRMLL